MLKKTDLNKQGLKDFLYHFFIIWNLLIIALLIILHFNIRILRFEKVKIKPKSLDQWGKFQLFWKSDKDRQDIGSFIYSLGIVDLNHDKIKDIIALSSSGTISGLNGKNGISYFAIEQIPPVWHVKIVPGKSPCILLLDARSNIKCLSDKGKQLWKIHGAGEMVSFSLAARKDKGFIMPVNFTKGLLFADTSGKILFQNASFNHPLFTEVVTYDFNNDNNDDILVGDTRSVYCLDGVTGNILWYKNVHYLYPGKFSIINGKDDEVYILVPLYNGNLVVLNKAGVDVWKLDLGENLVDAPVVYRNKDDEYCFVQSTKSGRMAAFNFSSRDKIWTKDSESSPVKLAVCDFNFDDAPEVVSISQNGLVKIINGSDGHTIDSWQALEHDQENIVSNLVIDDMDNDGNFEITFASDRGNVYVYSYKVFKKFNIWKLFLGKKGKWDFYGGNIKGSSKFH
ncbi:MAG: PQQ-binding-like beta-propeller repeat protein [Spirochaetes bacterium]|nr:PQQ-binding-like beta-propeller repeat protein [Spirochaetota bacterium]